MKLTISYPELINQLADTHHITVGGIEVTDLPLTTEDERNAIKLRVEAVLHLLGLPATNPNYKTSGKINAIKFLREKINGLGLAEAKTLVEADNNGFIVNCIKNMLETGSFFQKI